MPHSEIETTQTETRQETMYRARCGDCHWFRENPEKPGNGRCMVMPPTIQPNFRGGQAPIAAGGAASYKTEFIGQRPSVDEDDYCQLFLERPQPPAQTRYVRKYK